MCINYKREIYVLAHLNLSTASFKCLSYRICFMFIINKHFNFCCFRALAYTTLDRLCAVFLYNLYIFNSFYMRNTSCKHAMLMNGEVLTVELSQ